MDLLVGKVTVVGPPLDPWMDGILTFEIKKNCDLHGTVVFGIN